MGPIIRSMTGYGSGRCTEGAESWNGMRDIMHPAAPAPFMSERRRKRHIRNVFGIIGYMNKTNIQKITPFLWFDHDAEEAAKFYTSIFKNSKIIDTTSYDKSAAEASGRPKGKVMIVRFELEGQLFMALNGGPVFNFSPAISFLVNCDTQEEVNDLWKRLSEGGKKDQCGWLKDKFGVSWQIVPRVLGEMLQDKDANKRERVMGALLQMKQIDIQGLRMAYEGH